MTWKIAQHNWRFESVVLKQNNNNGQRRLVAGANLARAAQLERGAAQRSKAPPPSTSERKRGDNFCLFSLSLSLNSSLALFARRGSAKIRRPFQESPIGPSARALSRSLVCSSAQSLASDARGASIKKPLEKREQVCATSVKRQRRHLNSIEMSINQWRPARAQAAGLWGRKTNSL